MPFSFCIHCTFHNWATVVIGTLQLNYERYNWITVVIRMFFQVFIVLFKDCVAGGPVAVRQRLQPAAHRRGPQQQRLRLVEGVVGQLPRMGQRPEFDTGQSAALRGRHRHAVPAQRDRTTNQSDAARDRTGPVQLIMRRPGRQTVRADLWVDFVSDVADHFWGVIMSCLWISFTAFYCLNKS